MGLPDEEKNRRLEPNEKLDQIVDAFSKVWCQGKVPNIHDFIGQSENSLRHPLLLRLIRIDIERRGMRGVARPLQDYFREFPELGADASAVSELADFASSLETRDVSADVPKLDSQTITVDLPNPQMSGPPRTPAIPAGNLATVSMTTGEVAAIRRDSAQVARARAVLKDGFLPETIGPFRIIRLLGRGGMGAVYEAEQSHPRRTVALKVIDAERVTDSALRRFEIETDAIARLEHMGIARMYEAGMAQSVHAPQPYFAMELVRGQTLTDFANLRHLSVAEKLDLLARLCDAVHYAHQRGVIHRDLKPANILVDESAQPKILDFGVARITDSDAQASTLSVEGNSLVGTILYMSPEQAGGNSRDLDTRSDIYTLGVLGFELLTGRMPHNVKEKPAAEVLRMIRFDEPARLATVDKSCSGDIDAIISKAIEKDPDLRYSSAAGMAADIRRFLDHEPVLARTHTLGYRVSTFTRRHTFGVGALVAVILALLAGVITTSIALHKAKVHQSEAEASRQEAIRQSSTAERASAQVESALIDSLVDQGGALALAGLPGQAGQRYEEAQARMKASAACAWQVDPAVLDLWQMSLPPCGVIDTGRRDTRGAGFLADGRTIWVVNSDGLREFDGATGRPGIQIDSRGANAVAWDHESSTLVVQVKDGLGVVHMNGDVKLQLLQEGAVAAFVAVSPGGRYAAAALTSEGIVQVWDLKTRRPCGQINLAGQVSCLALSRDGETLATGDATGEVKCWKVSSKEPLAPTVLAGNARVACACFATDEMLVTGGTDKTIRVWNVRTGKLLSQLFGHRGGIVALAVSRDGTRALSGSVDQTAKLWDLRQHREIQTYTEQHGSVGWVTFGNDDHMALCSGAEGQILVHDVDREAVPEIFGPAEGLPLAFASIAQNGLVALGSERGGHITLVDIPTGRALASIDAGGAGCAAVFPNCDRVVVCAPGRMVRLWIPSQAGWLSNPVQASGEVTCVTVSATGESFLVGCDNGDLQLFNSRAELLRTFHGQRLGVSCVAFSADSKRVACGTYDHKVIVCDLDSGIFRELGVQANDIATCIGFDPEGGRVFSGGRDGVLRIWDVKEERMIHDFSSDEHAITAAAFSADGRWILSGGEDGSLKVWGMRALSQAGVLRGDTSEIAVIVLAPDGWKALSRGGRIWDFSLPATYRKTKAQAVAARELLQSTADPVAMRDLGDWYATSGPPTWATALFTQAEASNVAVPPLESARSYWRSGDGSNAAAAFRRAAATSDASLQTYLKLCASAAKTSAATSRQSK